MKSEPVYLIDGSAYIYRAYHAITPLTTSQGLATHAVYGFINMLRRVIKEKAPSCLAIAFDLKGPTFRHRLYHDYKANRPPMPEDLACQIPYIHQVTQAFNVPSLKQEEMEADDLIAAAATTLADQGHDVIIVSGDKDLLQLVSPRITMWDPMRNKIMDEDAVLAKYQVEPQRLTDLFALIGDSSDNIPGISGIGPKTAAKLLSEFETLDKLLSQLHTLKKSKMKERLISQQDKAILSRQLIRLNLQADVPQQVDSYRLGEPDHDQLFKIYTELEFNTLAQDIQPAKTIDTKDFHLVKNEKELKEVIGILQEQERIYLDTETSSLDPLMADLVGISLAIDQHQAWYIPLGHGDEEGNLQPDQLERKTTLASLEHLLTSQAISKVGHNIKFDYRVLKHQGLTLAGPLIDTMIASYLLEPSRRNHKLDELCLKHLSLETTSFAQVTNNDKRADAFIHVSIPDACTYSCEDVAATCLLLNHFQPQLKDRKLWNLFIDLENALIPILADMEDNGILVNPAILEDLSREFAGKLDKLKQKIYELAGEEFNINSTQQLGAILFDKFNLPHGKKTKTGYSTNVKVLEKLSAYHDLPGEILNHRSLNKLKSTYVDKLASQLNPHTRRIHTSFNQTITATGRLSSSNPNLQNIPVRTAEGQRIRQALIAPDSHQFLAADYSQIDLRVLAHYSQDPVLLEAFANDDDIHSRTAAEIFRVNTLLITPQMRRVAKTINFGIVYGMSAFGLADQLNISRKEAQTFINRYFTLYAGVKDFMARIIAQAREDGYVTTLLHRRRPLPEITSSNKTRREFAERTAINTPIQGTAADIIKLATLHGDKALKKSGLSARIILQIHDELVFEVPDPELEPTGELIKQTMESVMELDVPLRVNISNGPDLASLK